MLKYKLENRSVKNNTTIIYCEICGKPALHQSINEFHKDGTIIMHFSCSNHVVDLYNKVIEDRENK
jgi:hypothetical protein